MSEPKREPIMGDAAKLNEALLSAAEYGGDFNSLRYWLTRAAEAIHPAPQPEAKAEPDYSCPKCGSMDAGDCICSRRAAAAAANARIAELVRERDEARAALGTTVQSGVRAGRSATYAAGAAAMRDAIAKRLEVWAAGDGIASVVVCIVRETEVPDA